jgi:hypothetical protein
VLPCSPAIIAAAEFSCCSSQVTHCRAAMKLPHAAGCRCCRVLLSQAKPLLQPAGEAGLVSSAAAAAATAHCGYQVLLLQAQQLLRSAGDFLPPTPHDCRATAVATAATAAK